jgi:hypothetical protein
MFCDSPKRAKKMLDLKYLYAYTQSPALLLKTEIDELFKRVV